ncbi:MAG: hypothetical protein WBN75_16510, partial [Verrucomicrobiia bacterium]
MSSVRLILTFGLAATVVLFPDTSPAGEEASAAALPAWTNVAQIRQFSGSGSGRNNPIRLQGVITLVDTNR